jgi:hypothetical protein
MKLVGLGFTKHNKTGRYLLEQYVVPIEEWFIYFGVLHTKERIMVYNAYTSSPVAEAGFYHHNQALIETARRRLAAQAPAGSVAMEGALSDVRPDPVAAGLDRAVTELMPTAMSPRPEAPRA